MPVRILPGYTDQIMAHIMTQLQIEQDQKELGMPKHQIDICDWAQENFYIPSTNQPIEYMPFQVAVMRLLFSRREDHHMPFQTIMYSTVKQSGKSTQGGVAARYMTETQTRFGEIFTVGNDLDQAKSRSFREARYSIEMTPGYDRKNDVLPGRWQVNKLSMRSVLTGSELKAIAVDAKGEAGGKPALSVWTELWGFEEEDSRRFWDELTPVPTVPDSIRMVETYAGYDGESQLLHNLWDVGMQGRQLSAGELAAMTCRENVPGETFNDLVNGWKETQGDPEVLVPVWVNDQASLAMYWDSGLIARRMPWQQQGDDRADEYYRGQEAILPPNAFRRLHLNEWVGAESQFVPAEAWEACAHEHEKNNWAPIEPIKSGDRTTLVCGIDAAVSGDCFGIIIVSRCPHQHDCVDIRGYKLWNPKDSGGLIDYDEPEAFLRASCKTNNIVQIAYDPYQLENMMQKFRKDQLAWCEPFAQGSERLVGDRQLYDMVIERRIHHAGSADITQHVSNANAKVQKDEDSKMRIVKKISNRKIDLVVALSMASARCMYLNL